VEVQDDPQSQRNIFIRSDQYSFIRKGRAVDDDGVDAEPHSKKEQIAKTWLTNRYHAPSDDLNQSAFFASQKWMPIADP
jgi:hypothetical protein